MSFNMWKVKMRYFLIIEGLQGAIEERFHEGMRELDK